MVFVFKFDFELVLDVVRWYVTDVVDCCGKGMFGSNQGLVLLGSCLRGVEEVIVS